MAGRIRTFIAIDVPARALRPVLDDLHEMGGPVKPAGETLHLTLKFLGDTNRAAIQDIATMLGETAALHASFDLRLGGIGAFPHVSRPSVIWAAVKSAEPLVRIAEAIASRLEPLGFPRETRPFHPHVTLARVKGRPPRELSLLFELYADESFGSVRISELTFYQSELTPRGSRYSILSTARLNPV